MVGLIPMIRNDDHRECEVRYQELLDRLRDASQRLERVEEDQRMIVDLLRDFRDLIRLVVSRLRTLDRRVSDVTTWRHAWQGPYERVARHFRN